jgi:DNA-binding transcriptional regulator YiaG
MKRAKNVPALRDAEARTPLEFIYRQQQRQFEALAVMNPDRWDELTAKAKHSQLLADELARRRIRAELLDEQEARRRKTGIQKHGKPPDWAETIKATIRQNPSLSNQKIADLVGCGKTTVSRWRKKS